MAEDTYDSLHWLALYKQQLVSLAIYLLSDRYSLFTCPSPFHSLCAPSMLFVCRSCSFHCTLENMPREHAKSSSTIFIFNSHWLSSCFPTKSLLVERKSTGNGHVYLVGSWCGIMDGLVLFWSVSVRPGILSHLPQTFVSPPKIKHTEQLTSICHLPHMDVEIWLVFRRLHFSEVA